MSHTKLKSALGYHKSVLNSKNTPQFVAIDLKSFYASVECCERQLDPLDTLLVVADESRTAKTICLAATPAIKAYGIGGRARLFQAIQKIKEANTLRKYHSPRHQLTTKSTSATYLSTHPEAAIDFIIAPPRMGLYIDYSARIYKIYLEFFAPEDIHIYSIDEVFIDLTKYLPMYQLDSHTLVRTVLERIIEKTGITATAGIGTNLYLAKIAMDIIAKHLPADINGVRMAKLDERRYRELLWNHRPLTDFWRVGKGYAQKLAQHHLFTMGDIARCSIGRSTDYYNEDLLYKLFGINAELLIDHSWGYETCTMKDIKSYKPASRSLVSGQVLHEPYTFEQARLVVWEMADSLGLDLFAKNLLTKNLSLNVGYDIANEQTKIRPDIYNTEIVTDTYGRPIPKPSHGTIDIGHYTNNSAEISSSIVDLYNRITHPQLLIRRLNISANKLVDSTTASSMAKPIALFDLDNSTTEITTGIKKISSKEKTCRTDNKIHTNIDFPDNKSNNGSVNDNSQVKYTINQEKEEKIAALQEAMLAIKEKFGKNAILKCTNLAPHATMKERNSQIGGHKA